MCPCRRIVFFISNSSEIRRSLKSVAVRVYGTKKYVTKVTRLLQKSTDVARSNDQVTGLLHGKIQDFSHLDIVKQPDCFWGYAYVRYRAEKKLAEKLQNAGITCYLPTVPHAYKMHYTKVITQVPMFPTYLFLCINREEATELRYKEKQIRRIDLQFDEYRENTLIAELKALQQCELLAKESPVLINPGIVAGDKVLIKSGSLKGLVTDVVRRDDKNDAIIVNVTILDQHVEYPISADELKRITE